MSHPTGITRILVSASQLMSLLEKQPEVELELVRNAVPQIATLLQQRAHLTKAQIEGRVNEAWKEMERDREGKYGLPRQARDIITDWLRAECREEAKILVAQEAKAMAKAAADEAVAKAMLKLGQDLNAAVTRSKQEVDSYIQDQVEQKFLELLRAGKLTVAS